MMKKEKPVQEDEQLSIFKLILIIGTIEKKPEMTMEETV